MVDAVSDAAFTPGNPRDHRYHYFCPGEHCDEKELVQTQLPDAKRRWCLVHKKQLTLCTDSECGRTGARHRVP
jgi:hypothetical protein